MSNVEALAPDGRFWLDLGLRYVKQMPTHMPMSRPHRLSAPVECTAREIDEE